QHGRLLRLRRPAVRSVHIGRPPVRRQRFPLRGRARAGRLADRDAAVDGANVFPAPTHPRLAPRQVQLQRSVVPDRLRGRTTHAHPRIASRQEIRRKTNMKIVTTNRLWKPPAAMLTSLALLLGATARAARATVDVVTSTPELAAISKEVGGNLV